MAELPFHIDSNLKRVMDDILYNRDDDWDFLIVVSGYPGSGKTELVSQLAYYINPEISLKTMVFNPDEFENLVKSLDKPSEIIWDESITGLYNENHGTKISKLIVMLLSQSRYKRHIYFLILPDFFVLNRNIAVTRSRALIHVYSEGIEVKNAKGDKVTKWDRGYFKFYNMLDKNKLYNNRKLGLEAYETTKPTAKGYFGAFFPFDKAEYTKLKTEAINKQNQDEKKNKGSKLNKDVIIEMIKRGRDCGVLWEDMATVLNVSSKTLQLYYKHAPTKENVASALTYNDNMPEPNTTTS